MDTGAPAIAAVRARRATDRAPHGTALAIHLCTPALGAQAPHQPLRLYAAQRRGQQERLHAHVGQTGHRRDRGVGVQRGQHAMAGQRGLYRDLRGFQVADLADHDRIRVLAQDRAQCGAETHADARIDLDLADTGEVVLHRVFHGQDVAGAAVELAQRRIQRGGLATAGRAGHQHDAVRLPAQPGEGRQGVVGHAEPLQLQAAGILFQQAQHRALAMSGRHRGHADVQRPAADTDRDAAVLRQALCGDVQMRHELDARNQRGMQGLARRHHIAQGAVHAVAPHGMRLEGLDVDIAGAARRPAPPAGPPPRACPAAAGPDRSRFRPRP
ncbi:hypothetical protein G6F24_013842 [Rhizopus arrhizus]|nr:hypothetical protein G6F24_013842 [Rhizopus arrhizus]